jgi:hypothetical protein
MENIGFHRVLSEEIRFKALLRACAEFSSGRCASVVRIEELEDRLVALEWLFGAERGKVAFLSERNEALSREVSRLEQICEDL